MEHRIKAFIVHCSKLPSPGFVFAMRRSSEHPFSSWDFPLFYLLSFLAAQSDGPNATCTDTSFSFYNGWGVDRDGAASQLLHGMGYDTCGLESFGYIWRVGLDWLGLGLGHGALYLTPPRDTVLLD